jgi:endonuclease YncB( thermonuclease family)
MLPLALNLILIAVPAWGVEYTARVVTIADGDITVLQDDDTQKVRLAPVERKSS